MCAVRSVCQVTQSFKKVLSAITCIESSCRVKCCTAPDQSCTDFYTSAALIEEEIAPYHNDFWRHSAANTVTVKKKKLHYKITTTSPQCSWWTGEGDWPHTHTDTHTVNPFMAITFQSEIKLPVLLLPLPFTQADHMVLMQWNAAPTSCRRVHKSRHTHTHLNIPYGEFWSFPQPQLPLAGHSSIFS